RLTVLSLRCSPNAIRGRLSTPPVRCLPFTQCDYLVTRGTSHSLGRIRPHTAPAGHWPQSIPAPQPSPVVPHSAPRCSHVSGTHSRARPHWNASSIPHTQPGSHTPQSLVPPQPSPITPHSALALAQERGLQLGLLPHWLCS